MKCQSCQSEMLKGSLAQGTRWVPKEMPKGIIDIGNSQVVSAFNCPNCGRIDLTTKA